MATDDDRRDDDRPAARRRRDDDRPGYEEPHRGVLLLVMGILSIVFAFCCSPIGLVLGLVGAVLGYLTRAEIGRTGVGKESENLALGGLITGGVGVVLSIIAFGIGASNAFGG